MRPVILRNWSWIDVHNEHTSVFSLSKVVKTKNLDKKNLEKLIVFVRIFEIVDALSNYSRRT